MESWIGIGHSCGATLLLQLPLLSSQDQDQDQISSRLRGLVLLAGIYSLPTFLSSHTPPSCPADIAKIYVSIVAGAFGSDEKVYEAVSPAHLAAEKLWGRHVVLGYSAADELVEPAQREEMVERYLKEGWMQSSHDSETEGKKVVEVRDLTLGTR